MRREGGQITVMTVGFLLFIGLLAVVVINSSAAFLERRQLDNIADGAAISAADGLSRDTFYQHGEVRLDGRQARRLVRQYVNAPDIRIVRVLTTDDQVTVRLEQRIELAIRPPGWSARTTIRAEATAQLRLAKQVESPSDVEAENRRWSLRTVRELGRPIGADDAGLRPRIASLLP